MKTNSTEVLDRIIELMTEQEIADIISFLNERYRDEVIGVRYPWSSSIEIRVKHFFIHTPLNHSQKIIEGVGIDANDPNNDALYYLEHDDCLVNLLAVEDCPHYTKIMAAIIGEE